jgi:DNA-binding MarR family transcriptional regulator
VTNPSTHAPRERSRETARAACDVVEVLEVVWERGRDTVLTAVSTPQLRVLRALEREDGVNLRTLGHALGSTPPSTSRLCDRLEGLGLVERSSSAASRRELELRLTSRGKTYLRELREKRELELSAALNVMSPARRADLLRGLRGLKQALPGL